MDPTFGIRETQGNPNHRGSPILRICSLCFFPRGAPKKGGLPFIVLFPTKKDLPKRHTQNGTDATEVLLFACRGLERALQNDAALQSERTFAVHRPSHCEVAVYPIPYPWGGNHLPECDPPPSAKRQGSFVCVCVCGCVSKWRSDFPVALPELERVSSRNFSLDLPYLSSQVVLVLLAG